MFFEISSLKNFAIFTGIHLCWGLFLIKLQAFRPSTFLKRNSNTVFPVDIAKFLRTAFFIEHLRRLLLAILPQYYCTIIYLWGACSLIFRLHMLSNLIKNLHKTLLKWFFTVTWHCNFFLAWIDLSRAFDFRIYFGKILVACDFDEKLTRSVAQITM